VNSFLCFLLCIFWLNVSILSAQRTDTVTSYRYLKLADSLRLAKQYRPAMSYYQIAAQGYWKYAESLPKRKKWNSAQLRAYEQFFYCSTLYGRMLNGVRRPDSAQRHLTILLEQARHLLGRQHFQTAYIQGAIGRAAELNQDYHSSILNHKAAIAILSQYQQGTLQVAMANSYMSLGLLYGKLSALDSTQFMYLKAVQLLKDNLTIPRAAEYLIDCYNALSLLNNQRSDFEQESIYLLRSLELMKQYSVPANQQAMTYFNYGLVLQRAKLNWEAIAVFKSALVTLKADTFQFKKQGQLALGSLAKSYERLGNYSLAITYYQAALDHINQQERTDEDARLTTLSALADCYLASGVAFDGATDTWITQLRKPSEALRQKPKSALDRLLPAERSMLRLSHESLAHLGRHHAHHTQQYDSALFYYTHAYAIEQMDTVTFTVLDQSRTLQELANAHYQLQQYSQAKNHTQHALKYLETIYTQLPQSLQKSYELMGDIAQQEQAIDSAYDWYSQAIKVSLPEAFAGKLDTAIFSQSVEVDRFLVYPLVKKIQLLNLYHRHFGPKALAEIQQLATFGERLIQKHQQAIGGDADKLLINDFFSGFYTALIDCYATHPTLPSARAYDFMESIKAQALQSLLNEREAYRFCGLPPAIDARRKALTQRLALLNESSRQLQALCPQCDSAQLQSLNSRTLEAYESLDSVQQVIKKEHARCYALKANVERVDVAALQAVLAKQQRQTALVSYVHNDSMLYAFVVTPTSYRLHRQPLPPAPASGQSSQSKKHPSAFHATIHQFMRNLNDPKLAINPIATFAEPSHKLYQYLIAPLERDIAGMDLVIIPHGHLHKLPFDVLIRQKPQPANATWSNLDYLLRRHSISYHYSGALWAKQQQAPKDQQTGTGFVAFAPVFADTITSNILPSDTLDAVLSIEQAEARKALIQNVASATGIVKPLPGTQDEVNSIGALFAVKGQPAEVYLNAQANEQSVYASDLSQYRYVHFATHGLADESQPQNSCLVLAQVKHPVSNSNLASKATTSTTARSTGLEESVHSNASDNVLSSLELYGLKLRAELVVLSACQTARGQVREGEGVIGLTRGLLFAGAQNVVASQWNVNDLSTSLLMKDFYRRLLAGGSVTASLREAKLELLHTHYACPHFWAAFTSIGK
jgi:CHAT domain-containing protein